MNSPTRLSAAIGAVLAVAALSASAALADGHPADHDDGGGTLLRSGVGGSQPSDHPLFGATPGGAPWVVTQGMARLSSQGDLRVSVTGLVIPGRGNPLPTLSASVYCTGERVATTGTVPFSAAGDAVLDTAVALPSRCLAPVVLVHPNANKDVFIAATGR